MFLSSGIYGCISKFACRALIAGITAIRHEGGAVAVVAGFSLIPIVASVGIAVDYARIGAARTKIQAALDSAVLVGAVQAASGRDEAALGVFAAQKPSGFGSVGDPTFVTSDDGLSYAGSVTATIDSQMMQLI